MTLTALLFSFKGRLNRMPWWVASLVTGVAAGILSALLEIGAELTGNVDPETETAEPTGIFGLASLVVSLVDLWIVLALCVKRLHDRDRTGWWLLAQGALLLGVVGLGLVAFAMSPDNRAVSVLAVLVGFVAFVVSLWLFVELGFLRGTKGPNRFGPDPLEPKIADPAPAP